MISTAVAIFLLSSSPSVGITASAVVGGQQPCPPYIIYGVYKPSDTIKTMGCYFKTGIQGAITVEFFTTQTEVPLATGQTARYARGHGFYAYPPAGNIRGGS